MKNTILVTQDDSSSLLFLRSMGYAVEVGLEVDEDKHVAVFVPGIGISDVDPALYNQERHITVKFIDPKLDAMLMEVMHQAMDRDVPIIGVCRGGQLLNVFNGGTLIQHVEGHNVVRHAIVNTAGDMVMVNSSHHQVMEPAPAVGEILAVTAGDDHPEVVYYPDTSSLCFQFHPEWNDMPEDGLEYAKSLINKLIKGDTLSD